MSSRNDKPKAFKLLLFMELKGNVFPIDTVYSSDKDELVEMGRHRCLENENYVAFINTYTLSDTERVE